MGPVVITYREGAARGIAVCVNSLVQPFHFGPARLLNVDCNPLPSQPEDSAATISDSTNLILSEDCSAQFTLSSNHIRYENGTINGKKPYATNGETPKKGSRVSEGSKSVLVIYSL